MIKNLKRFFMKNFKLFLCLLFLLGMVIEVPKTFSFTETNTIKKTQFENIMKKMTSQKNIHVIIGLRHESQLKIRERQAQFFTKFPEAISLTSRQYRYTPAIALTVDQRLLERLLESNEVMSIEEDVILKPTLAESTQIIEADAAWARGYTGSGQAVGIIDTGLDTDHPFYAGRIVAEACYSHNLCPGADPTEAHGSGASEACDPTFDSDCNHGTYVTGVTAGNNGVYGQTILNGVAKDAMIISINMSSRYDDDPACNTEGAPVCICGTGVGSCMVVYGSDMISGMEGMIDIALDTNFNYPIASVIVSGAYGNYSTYCDSSWATTKEITDDLKTLNIAVVVPTGNNGYTNGIGYPSCLSGVISVGNTQDDDTVRASSNSAPILSLLAPGTNIITSMIGGSYTSITGTSVAGPHVVGAFAILRQMLPYANVDDLLAILVENGKLVTDTKSGVTTPRIDMDQSTNIPCTLNTAADTTVTKNCIIQGSPATSGNITVSPDKRIFIKNGTNLDMDLENSRLLIDTGGKILIEPEGKIY